MARPVASPDPRLRLVLTHLEDAARRFGPCPNTPPGHEGARECGISEVDREGVIGYRPAIRTAILVEPGGDLGMTLAEALWRNGDPDADGKAPFGRGEAEMCLVCLVVWL